MPVQFTNLGINLYHAEASQQIQNLFLVAERVNNQVAAEKTQDIGKAQTMGQVQSTAEVDTSEIRGEGHGAHRHTLEGSRSEAESEESRPSDPGGKGQNLDLMA